MITVGMGMPPLTRFTNAGVQVYSDRVSPTVGEALAAFVAGKTQLMDPSMACRH